MPKSDRLLADLLSAENISLKDRLLIVLQNNHYKFAKGKDEYGISLYGEIQFKDNQKAYKEFWRKYKRPHRKYIGTTLLNAAIC